MPAPSRGGPRDFTAAGLGVIHAMTMLRIAEVETPIGPMYCAVRDGRLCTLEFAERWPHRLAWLERRLGAFFTHPDPDPAGVVRRLADYFAGRLDALSDVAIELTGTP